jgi:hypothetical protein
MIRDMKKKVEEYWDYLYQKDPYNRSILEGTVKPEMISFFLANIHYLVQHTPIHLKKAMAIAESRGDKKLKEYFALKMKEESGHDKWAEADLEKLSRQHERAVRGQCIDPSMVRLIKHIESLIERDPHLYLAYIFFAEYLCVIYGPDITQALERTCGYPARSMTVIENHAALDKEHVHEWETVLPGLVGESRYREVFLKTVDETITIHRAFFLSCASPKHEDAA